MGECADDLIDGRVCSWCGVYFRESHGYPVLCHDCYQTWQREGRAGSKRTGKKLLADYGLKVACIKKL